MSIPPLVCSTPPPPDQCEDDKDPEDYDLQYNLSQDDEDDHYDFGNFSSYNHFQSSQSNTNPINASAVDSVNKDDTSKHKECTENFIATNIASEKKDGIIEETNIEDLDLKLQTDDDNSENHIEPKSSQDNTNLIEKDIKTAVELRSDLQSDEYVKPPSLEQSEDPPSYVDEIITAVDNLQLTPTAPELPIDLYEGDEAKEDLSISESQDKEVPTPTIETEAILSEPEALRGDDDDFGDFDDFKFASPIDKLTTLDNCDNPWENSNVVEDDFSNFKANFEEGDSNIFTATESATEHSVDINNFEENVETVEANNVESVADDDFGDFNNFQTPSGEARNSIDTSEGEEPFPLLSLLNVQGNDDQIMEYINNVINTVFENEIEEPVEEFNVKLESVLGVTWGHLLAVDERQPYMVNWNNSLGQKTLLKALCIDSRNILFGPKWNYNMPKYAAALSVAPLQPQKQVTSSAIQAEPSSQDKNTSKPGSWSDPFVSDGKESTYAETLLIDLEHLMATLDQMAHSHSTVKISELLSHACKPEHPSQNPVIESGPTDLDVFEASTSSKPDKIYSSTLNIQPIRQISLPDTHIFTPTDSETPRSTTIHYDNRPTVLLPQTAIESESSFKGEQTVSPQPSTSRADDEYWEFQDFKGASTSSTLPSTNLAPKPPEIPSSNPNVTYRTQVLQPIKVEPIMPTLNWPDPGEVKETFDDFSDFVSSTILNSLPIPTVPKSQIENKPLQNLVTTGIAATKTNENISAGSGDFEDDFDTFQSAVPAASFSNISVPSGSGVSNIPANGIGPGASTALHPPIANFDYAFPKVDKSETISFETTNKPKESLQTGSKIFASNLEMKAPPLQTSSATMAVAELLQPITVNSTATLQNQQKSGQILQPLSLESFSQINWPNPGIDLQDLSRFNPVETLHSLKSDLSVNSQSKLASPVHGHKNAASSQLPDDEWGDFVSSKPKPQPMPKKQATLAADDDEWTDFVSSPSVKPQNGLNTISFNVHTNTNLTIQKPNPGKFTKKKQLPLDIPTLNYITPKSTNHKAYNDRHLNL